MYITGAIFDQNLGGVLERTIAAVIAMISQTVCLVRVCRSAVENTMMRPMSESTVTATIIPKLVFFCIMCDGKIHYWTAKEEARILEKASGMKAGVLCCQCHEKVKIAQEIIGNDKFTIIPKGIVKEYTGGKKE